MDAVIENYSANLHGRTILDYDCSSEDKSLRYLRNGAEKVCAISSSHATITNLTHHAANAGYAGPRCDFRTMNLLALDFADESFDCVIGSGALHQLDVPKALAEIHRVLKPGGRLLMQEPLRGNALLKIFRKITPYARKVNSVPFSRRQIREIESSQLWQSTTAYCGILEMPLSMITSKLLPEKPENAWLRVADKAEQWLNRKHIFTGWNQYVVFNLVKLDPMVEASNDS